MCIKIDSLDAHQEDEQKEPKGMKLRMKVMNWEMNQNANMWRNKIEKLDCLHVYQIALSHNSIINHSRLDS